MNIRSIAHTVVVFSLIVSSRFDSADGKEPNRVDIRLWSSRLVDQTSLVLSDQNLKDYEHQRYLCVAVLCLGEAGRSEDAKRLIALIEQKKELRSMALMFLADGESTSGRLDRAIATAKRIDGLVPSDRALSMVAIRQSQIGSFDNAKMVAKQIQSDRPRNGALKQISIELARVDRFEAAQELTESISDPTAKMDASDEIARLRSKPSVEDPGYVDYEVDVLRNGVIPPSDNQLAFIKHLKTAEVHLHFGRTDDFHTEAAAAGRILEQSPKLSASKLSIAKLYDQNGDRALAAEFCRGAMDGFITDKEPNPFNFRRLLFVSGDSDEASLVVRCLPRKQLETILEKMLKDPSTHDVAAALIGAIVRDGDPDWGDAWYQSAEGAELKAQIAALCLTRP